MSARFIPTLFASLLILAGCAGDGHRCNSNCEDRQCGDDGCGGSCGDCPASQVCSPDGSCCEPCCQDKVCGDDGCGGSCGECTGEDVCHAGRCVNYTRKFPGPCVVTGDILIDGREDYRYTFTYDEAERLIVEDRDEFSDGVIEERKTFEYDDSGKLVVSELDYWADGDVEYRGTITYYPDGQIDTLTTEDFTENPEKLYVEKHYYDDRSRLTTRTMDTRADGIIESVFTYTYYDGTDLLLTKERDDHPLGSADIRWLYRYEGNTTILEYDDPIGGPIEALYRYSHDDEGNLVREEWDNNADGTVDDLLIWVFNADGCLVRKEVDYGRTQKLDQLHVYDQDRLCNLLHWWAGDEEGFTNLEVSDYSCWLD